MISVPNGGTSRGVKGGYFISPFISVFSTRRVKIFDNKGSYKQLSSKKNNKIEHNIHNVLLLFNALIKIMISSFILISISYL